MTSSAHARAGRRLRATAVLASLLLAPAVAPPHAFAASPGTATAATTAGLDDRAGFDELLERLDDPSFAVREAATEALMDRADLKGRIIGALDGWTSTGEPGRALSVEQRERLLMILRHHVLNAPRGAIGIRMNPGIHEPGVECVEVAFLIPDMPAERALEVGDRILEIDGRRIRGSDDLADAVQSRLPGEEIEVRLMRIQRDAGGAAVIDRNRQPAYEELVVELELARYDELPHNDDGPIRMNPIDRVRAEEAASYELRFATRPRPVDLGELLSGPAGVGTAWPSLDIEEHPLARELLANYRALLVAGEGARVPAEDFERWEAGLRDLESLLDDRGIPIEDRLTISRLTTRCRDLLRRIIQLNR